MKILDLHAKSSLKKDYQINIFKFHKMEENNKRKNGKNYAVPT